MEQINQKSSKVEKRESGIFLEDMDKYRNLVSLLIMSGGSSKQIKTQFKLLNKLKYNSTITKEERLEFLEFFENSDIYKNLDCSSSDKSYKSK